MVVQLSLTMQQESGLKRQVIDVGHINVQEVRIEDGQSLESGVHDVHVGDRCKAIGGQLVCFHIIMDTHFIHVVFWDRVHLT